MGPSRARRYAWGDVGPFKIVEKRTRGQGQQRVAEAETTSGSGKRVSFGNAFAEPLDRIVADLNERRRRAGGR